MNEKLRRAIEAYNAAVGRMNEVVDLIEGLADDAADDAVATLDASFDTATAEVDRCKAEKDRLERVQRARENSPAVEIPAPVEDEQDAPVIHARAKGSTKEEPTYRPDRIAETSFFRDILSAKSGNVEARDRLDRNREEAIGAYLDKTGIDYRDMSNTSTAGAEFVPTIYLNDLWVSPAIAKRPFADALQKYPLPATGTTLSIPHLSSGVTVAARSDAGTVSETDGVTASITHGVNEIAGQVDIGRVAVFRSEPGLDAVIGATLVRRYHAYLDTQCLSGTGTAPQHMGIRAVSSAGTVTHTQTTPTQATTISKLYEAIAGIATNRIENEADMLVMHPRRADWLASGVSTSTTLFQQGSLFQTVGSQDGGFIETFAGSRVIRDVNVGTTYGAATNEDEIYVLASSDLYLAEGPLLSRVFEDVGSGTGVIRYQVFAYSAAITKRYPKSIVIISGTGLAAPTWS